MKTTTVLAVVLAYFALGLAMLAGAYAFPYQIDGASFFPVVFSILLLVPIYVWYRGYRGRTDLSEDIKQREKGTVFLWILALYVLALSIRIPSVLLFSEPYEKTPLILLIVLTIAVVEKTDLSTFGFMSKRFWKGLFYGLMFFVLLNALALSIIYLLVFMLTGQMAFHSYNLTPFLLAMPFMTFCVGISEEGLFRGYMQTHLRKFCTPAITITIQALFFGLWHFVWNLSPFNPTQMISYVVMTFLVGLLFGYFYEKTRSLVPLVFAHGLWNSVPQGISEDQAVFRALREVAPNSEILIFSLPYILTALVTFLFIKYFAKRFSDS